MVTARMKQLNWRRGLWRIWVIGTVAWAAWTFWDSDIGPDCLNGWCRGDFKDYFLLLVSMFVPPVLVGILVRWVIAGFEKPVEPMEGGWPSRLTNWWQWFQNAFGFIVLLSICFISLILYLMNPSWNNFVFLAMPLVLGPATIFCMLRKDQ